jgi:hypothetical protein
LGKVDAMRMMNLKRGAGITYFTQSIRQNGGNNRQDLILKELTDDEGGINYVIWDYTINPSAVKDYEKHLNDTKKKR